MKEKEFQERVKKLVSENCRDGKVYFWEGLTQKDNRKVINWYGMANVLGYGHYCTRANNLQFEGVNFDLFIPHECADDYFPESLSELQVWIYD